MLRGTPLTDSSTSKQSAQHQIHDQNVGFRVPGHLNGLEAIPGLGDNFQAFFRSKRFDQDGAKIFAGVGDHNSFVDFHTFDLPPLRKTLGTKLSQNFQWL